MEDPRGGKEFPNRVKHEEDRIGVIKPMQKARVAEFPLVEIPEHVIVEKERNEVEVKRKIFADLLPEKKERINSGEDPNAGRVLRKLLGLPLQ